MIIKQQSCFVRGQGQKREQKQSTKNFVGFHNHSPLATTACFELMFLATEVFPANTSLSVVLK